MATKNGQRTLDWLKERSWTQAPNGAVDQSGDPEVVDPQSKKQIGIFEAVKLQRDRNGEYPDFLREGEGGGQPQQQGVPGAQTQKGTPGQQQGQHGGQQSAQMGQNPK